jgi:hypothetical protein
MLNRSFIYYVLFSFFFLAINAQKKKEIKKQDIKTITSTKTIGTKILKVEKLTYNPDGLLVEELKYDEEGNLLHLIKYNYNIDEQLIEESKYSALKILIEKRKIK